MSNIDNTNVSKVLGQIVEYPKTYDKKILVREPRSSNRVHLNIDDNALPFIGVDVWNAYEVSALTGFGLPVAGLLKIVYPANSKYIVESKSLKLYLNSFNMSYFGNTKDHVVQQICETVRQDLSDLLETHVECRFYNTREIVGKIDSNPDEKFTNHIGWDMYSTIEESFDINHVQIDVFQENKNLLTSDYKYCTPQLQRFHSSLLKSNCRVTKQPDWGDVFIDIKTRHAVNPVNLLKYIISFRDECHFHEEICETIFTRLFDRFQPDILVVKCLYTRRGGIDICPIRAHGIELTDNDFNTYKMINVNIPHTKTPRQ